MLGEIVKNKEKKNYTFHAVIPSYYSFRWKLKEHLYLNKLESYLTHNKIVTKNVKGTKTVVFIKSNTHQSPVRVLSQDKF